MDTLVMPAQIKLFFGALLPTASCYRYWLLFENDGGYPCHGPTFGLTQQNKGLVQMLHTLKKKIKKKK